MTKAEAQERETELQTLRKTVKALTTELEKEKKNAVAAQQQLIKVRALYLLSFLQHSANDLSILICKSSPGGAGPALIGPECREVRKGAVRAGQGPARAGPAEAREAAGKF